MKKIPVSVSGFTGFEWTKGRFVYKIAVSTNTPIRVDVGVDNEQSFI